MISQYIIRFLSLIFIGAFVLVGCGGGAATEPAPAATAPAATPTSQAATPIPETPTPTAAPAATPTLITEKVTFEFVKQLSTAEEMDEIAPDVEQIEGVDRVSGNEVSITITYDPEVITPDELRADLAQMGHAVKE